MKKLLLTLVLLVGILLSAQKVHGFEKHQTSSAQLVQEAQVVEESDYRAKALEKVFSDYNSPLQGYGAAYVSLAEKNGVDWRLLPAISGLESGFAKHMMPGSHNAYGWGGGYIYFSSWEEGIDTITKSLKARYYDRGADTVWTIGPIYAESPTWSVRVNSFMERIQSEYVKIMVETPTITI